jgi:predicted ATPase/class 3 adenylate cyclase
MQAAMAEFAETQTSQGTFPLQMKVAIHYGRFFAAQLGTAQSMEYALLGADVNKTAALESVAAAGQIVTDRVTLAMMEAEVGAISSFDYAQDGSVQAISLDEDHVLIEAASPWPLPEPSPTPQLLPDLAPDLSTLRQAVKLLDVLSPYLPSGLLNRLALPASFPPNRGEVRGGTSPTGGDIGGGEHRLVAILFSNLHGMGDIADQLGPGREAEIIEALNQIFVAFTTALARYGGVVNKIDLTDHGDKLLAFFGAPIAHEDDAERVVRSALQMQQALADLNKTLPNLIGLPDWHLEQQIGISYGTVFAGYVGADWRREYTVMGDEVNLAARLMAAAEAGRIIVSHSIQRKVQALFDLPSRGEVQLKGKENPISIYEVTGLRAVPEPLRGLKGMHSPLVGREAEWQQLKAALAQVRQERGQIISIMGEAGLGKSRLVEELRRVTAADLQVAHIGWMEGRCLSYTENASYWPFQEALQRLILPPNGGERGGEDERDIAISKLRQALEQWLSPAEVWDMLPYLANFLNLELTEELQVRVRYLDAEALQRRTFLALRTLLQAQADKTPLILVLDDLHWLDNASARLLEYLLPLVVQAAVMFVLVFRPERSKVCWQIHEKARREFDYCTTQITLNLLPTADSEQLLRNLVGLTTWPDEARSLIFSRSEGNPLYLEEVLRALINNGTLVRDNGSWHLQGDVTAVSVPDTLQGVMMARLDRLSESSRRTAQIGAVVGRSFPFDLISYVTPAVPDQAITPHLVQLQQYEIIQETQRLPEIVYAFKHTLMQEVCYRTLSTRLRRQYHQRIAHYLAENQSYSAGEGRGRLPLIAHHAYSGQDWEMALRYQILAGAQAQKLFANKEALDHFHKALACSQHLAEADEKERLYTIQAALGELLLVTSQYDEAQTHLEQAHDLALASGRADSQAYACRQLAQLYQLRGDYTLAFEWIGRGLALLEGQETAEAAELLLISGLIHTRQGHNKQALADCQRALQLAQNLGELVALARANTLLGHITLAHGQSQEATFHFQTAYDLYVQAGDVNGQAHVHNQLARSYFSLGQWPQAEAHYRQAQTIFEQMGDLYHRVFADNNLAELLLKSGKVSEAITLYQAALKTVKQIGGSTYVLGALENNLGAAFIRQGEAGAATDHLQASQAYFEQAQARDFLPELHRHLAEAALLNGEIARAENEGQTARQLARELAMPGEEGASLRVLGDQARLRGDFAQAEKYLLESITILEEVADEYELARSQFSLAQTYQAAGQVDKAQELIRQCLVVFERLAATMDITAVRAWQQRIGSK